MAPAPRILPDTELGRHAVAGYSRYVDISADDFIRGMASPPTAAGDADGVVELVTFPTCTRGGVFIVSGRGLEAVSA